MATKNNIEIFETEDFLFPWFYAWIYDEQINTYLDELINEIKEWEQCQELLEKYKEDLKDDDDDKDEIEITSGLINDFIFSSKYSDKFDLSEKFYTEFAKKYFSYIKTYFGKNMEEELWINDLEFIKLFSPKDYNYSNDQIIFKWKVNIDKFINYIENNKERIESFISRINKRGDWYIPNLSDNIDEYINDLKEWVCLDCYVTQILGFFLLKETEKKCIEKKSIITDCYNAFHEKFLWEYSTDLKILYYDNLECFKQNK